MFTLLLCVQCSIALVHLVFFWYRRCSLTLSDWCILCAGCTVLSLSLCSHHQRLSHPWASATRRQSQIDLYLINASFQNPRHVPRLDPPPVTKGELPSKEPPPSHLHFKSLTVLAVQTRDQPAGFYVVKRGHCQIKRPLKPCLWGATWHSQFYPQWLCPISCSGWQLIKQLPWGHCTVIFCPYPQVC